MSKSRERERELYFDKHIRNASTADVYLKELLNSPYRTHKRMGILLGPELERLIGEKQKADESKAFAERISI